MIATPGRPAEISTQPSPHAVEQADEVESRFDRRDLLALVLLAGLLALFFWRLLTPNLADRAQFPPGDFTDQFYAFRLYEARALAVGRLPLWSENYNSGHPFLADIQAAVWYPIGLANTLLHLALTRDFSLFALELEALLHFWLAGAFTYLFARRVIGPRVPAFGAALVFTFGGYLTSYPSLQLAILETAAWLPLALYCLDRAAAGGEPRARWAIFAGLTLGVSALAGHPQTFLFVGATSTLYFFFRSYFSSADGLTFSGWLRGRGFRAAAGLFVLVLVIAAGLAAAQLVPALEYQRLSTREPLSFAEAAKGLATLDLLQFILPGFASAFASPLYVGVLPLWLALFALRRPDRIRWFWGLAALGALLLAFGFYVFAYAALYALIPGAGLFRQQERFALVVSFALALLAGFGLQDLCARQGSLRAAVRRFFWFLPAGALISLMLMLAFYLGRAEGNSLRQAFLADRAGLMLLLFTLAAVLVAAYEKRWLSPRSFAALALLLILFDLFSVNEPANKGAAVDRFPGGPVIEKMQSDPTLFRVAADEGVLPGHFGIPYRLEEIGGISPLRLAHYALLLQLPPERRWPLLGVKYLVSREGPGPGMEKVGEDGEVNLYRLNDARTRAWLAGSALVEPDDGRALALLGSTEFDSARAVVLATAPPFAPQPQAEGGRVVIEKHEPEHLVLSVDSPADGLLVLSENDYPGWRATVDNAPAPILRADITLRAIPVRQGVHRVELVFDPFSYKAGLALSLLTLALALAALAWTKRGLHLRESAK